MRPDARRREPRTFERGSSSLCQPRPSLFEDTPAVAGDESLHRFDERRECRLPSAAIARLKIMLVARFRPTGGWFSAV